MQHHQMPDVLSVNYGGREGSPAAGTAGMGGYRRRVGAGMSGYRRRVRAGTDNYAT